MEAAGRCVRSCLMSGSVNEAVSTRFRVWCINGSRVDWPVGGPYNTVRLSEWVKESPSGLDDLAGFECEVSRKADD